MERFWSNSIFKYLRVEPEDHYFLLTEPVSAVKGLLQDIARIGIDRPYSLSTHQKTAKTLQK